MRHNSGLPFADPVLEGLEEAESLFGPSVRVDSARLLPEGAGGARHPFGQTRAAEIIMVLPRPEGLILHTKAFYPPEVLRLPSGGIHPGERIVEAAEREVREETGLSLSPRRFLFHLIQHHQQGPLRRRFHSLAFLFPLSTEPVTPMDPSEEITEIRAFPWEHLPEVARILENLDPTWAAWGQFRAVPHRLLLQVRSDHPEWFRPAADSPPPL